jgi:hypothetical protein
LRFLTAWIYDKTCSLERQQKADKFLEPYETPMNRPICFSIALAILVLCSSLLVLRSPILSWAIVEEPYFPMGTVITWLGLIALSATVLLSGKPAKEQSSWLEHGLAWGKWTCLAATLLWLPLSVFLAGNLAFVFDSRQGFQGSVVAAKTFWLYSFTLLVLPTALALFTFLMYLYRRFRRSS